MLWRGRRTGLLIDGTQVAKDADGFDNIASFFDSARIGTHTCPCRFFDRLTYYHCATRLRLGLFLRPYPHLGRACNLSPRPRARQNHREGGGGGRGTFVFRFPTAAPVYVLALLLHTHQSIGYHAFGVRERLATPNGVGIIVCKLCVWRLGSTPLFAAARNLRNTS